MMMKRKDSGFTLIELMIVIAVIGILAIVLVPRIGTVKSQAKATGLDTNVRLVQGYVESKIDKWVSTAKTNSQVANDIKVAFSGENKQIINPFTSLDIEPEDPGVAPDGNEALYILNDSTSIDSKVNDPVSGLPVLAIKQDADHTRGTIIVDINPDNDTDTISSISIYAFGDDGVIIDEKTVTITP